MARVEFNELDIELHQFIRNELLDCIMIGKLMGYDVVINTADLVTEEEYNVFINFSSGDKYYTLALFVYTNGTLWKIVLYNRAWSELDSGLLKVNLSSPLKKLKYLL